ncbi:glyoxylase I 4-like [Rutidosis leptorrhynchoides]|uniref:glyoxylase I 4-like n=1 Tax=Rutidosis leptorrhynchoides TaxID=125765 RepID=UPI003A994F1A
MAKQQVVMEGNQDTLFGSSSSSQQLPLLSLNHVSFRCKNVRTSVKFYNDVLGFVLIRRPSSFDFEGAWLFNHGIGIHLLEVDTTPSKRGVINPKDNHISFECTNMDLVINKLEELDVKYVTAMVMEGGVEVNQLFFHDPDGNMIEICNCHVLPVLPLTSSCPIKKLNPASRNSQIESSYDISKSYSCGEDHEALMMENLLIDMMGISF